MPVSEPSMPAKKPSNTRSALTTDEATSGSRFFRWGY
jgi:hypothetical protein